ncbi:MAG: hypothetical protein IJE16_01875 [Ruminococcus sp.]|nr:hypothetical protein [Ruminococcus sp.]
MKRVISLILVFILLVLCAAVSVSAEGSDISDELMDAIRELENDETLTKDDFSLWYSYEISKDKYLVRYDRKLAGSPAVMCEIVMGEYKMTIGQPPIPMILYNGKLYETKVAYDEGIIDYDDLEVMSTFEKVSIEKIGWSYEEDFVKAYAGVGSEYSYEEVYHYYGGNYLGSSPDWVLAKGYVSDKEVSDTRYLKYDDFVLVCKESTAPFTMGYGVFFTPWDGYGGGHCFYDLVSDFQLIAERMDGFTDILKEQDEAVEMGDCDGDDALSVMDATQIQRVVANLDTAVKLTDERGVEFYFEDADSDGDISVLDATAIQMKLAKLEDTVTTE